jgi:antirestriction protein
MIQEQIQPRIYVACLAAYNAGKLHGKWIPCDDMGPMQEAIKGMLAASPEADTEEWAIHDYEGFGSLSLSEYQSLERVAAMAELIREHGELATQMIEHHCGDVDAARQSLEEDYQGCFQSLEHYAEQFMEDTGALQDLPKHLEGYIDFERMAHDWELNGDIFTIEPSYNEVHVFLNR